MLQVLKKHWDILVAAWVQESASKKERVKYKQEEFLPAALEILEKPASPLWRAIMWTIIAFFLTAVIWSFLGRVDVVSTARGKTLPRENVKVVQASEAGVVQAIHVANGVHVKSGDLLIELDATNAAADHAQAEAQLAIAEIALASSEALLRFIEGDPPVFKSPVLDEATVRRQQAFINSQVAEFEAQHNTLSKLREERTADIAVVRGQAEKLRLILPMIREQVETMEILAKQGYISRLLLLEQRERLVSMEQDLVVARDKIAKANAAFDATNRQIDQIRAEFRKTVLADLTEAQARVRLAREDINKANLRHTLQSLKAPVDGVVQQLAVHTIGGVVEPAKVLMVVVPGKGELVVEALVLNKDISSVEEGNIAEVKLDAVPFTKHGTITGTVEYISNDAINDENLGLVYHARIKLARQSILVNGHDVNLSPGMLATVEVKTGKRRLIEYLLSPLLRYRDEAFRER